MTNGNDLKVQGYEPRNEETIMKVFNKIIEQGKNLLIKVYFVKLRIILAWSEWHMSNFISQSQWWDTIPEIDNRC